ncbi:hypothetical protein DEF28_24965, partial [Marinitenerispora sediminis]
MELPDELANLFYGLTGTKWPKVDEDRLRQLGDVYGTTKYILETDLPELVVILRRKVEVTFDGYSNEFFQESLNQFTAGKNDYVGKAAELAAEIEKYAKEAANQVEYAKWMVIAQLIQLALEIAWAISMAFWTGGSSLAWIPMFRFIRNQLIRRIINWLVWTLLGNVAIAVLFAYAMDAIIQRIQIAEGNREENDDELTRMALLGGVVEGLLSAGLSTGFDAIISKELSGIFGKNLDDLANIDPPPPGRGPAG